MGILMEKETKRWIDKRKAALINEIIQGITIFSEPSRAFDIASSEVEDWVNDAIKAMETLFEQILWIFVNKMNGNSKICRRLMVRPCSIFLHEKSYHPYWA